MENPLVTKEEFIAKVEELIANGDGPFSIVVADIDNFENINKIYGYPIGDEVVKKLGKNKVCLSEAESMALKSSYFTKTQIDWLSELSKDTEKTEAFLLREALDDLFKKYSK